MKTISVLVAAWRAERWLHDCISSVQSQHLPAGWNCEVLVGVDGCGDTAKAAYAQRCNNLSVVCMTRNVGTYVTFNTLMKFATGRLICRFDADDVMREDFLARHIEEIGRGRDMTMSWSIYTDADLVPTDHVGAHPNYHPPGGFNRRASEGQFVMRRAVWRRLGGFRAWRCAADSDFLERARHAGFRVGVIDEFLYYRRTHPDSLIAHPATNFSSTLRIRLERVRANLLRGYQESTVSLRVEPVHGHTNGYRIGRYSDL